jgi:cell division protease FtsH
MERETLDKEEVAEIFKPLRRRPVRPAWTGSPDRAPSSIPPIDVPEKVRVAAAQGPLADEEEGAVVITPPGAGGDLHGGSEPGHESPTPPSQQR